mmetsp:Transcript_46273/g.94619  ORF Transcript_46273/g.94619 Transcript_46273/m.94619 type:complete len:209 (-) Transcript_46273:1167-1793(-)
MEQTQDVGPVRPMVYKLHCLQHPSIAHEHIVVGDTVQEVCIHLLPSQRACVGAVVGVLCQLLLALACEHVRRRLDPFTHQLGVAVGALDEIELLREENVHRLRLTLLLLAPHLVDEGGGSEQNGLRESMDFLRRWFCEPREAFTLSDSWPKQLLHLGRIPVVALLDLRRPQNLRRELDRRDQDLVGDLEGRQEGVGKGNVARVSSVRP